MKQDELKKVIFQRNGSDFVYIKSSLYCPHCSEQSLWHHEWYDKEGGVHLCIQCGQCFNISKKSGLIHEDFAIKKIRKLTKDVLGETK